MAPVTRKKFNFNRIRSSITMNKVVKSTSFKITARNSSNSSLCRRTAVAAERVTFLVGHTKQKFRIRPFVLASNSDVFRKMLEAPQWAPSKDRLGRRRGVTIELVDIKPEAFRILLMSTTLGLKRLDGRLTMSLAFDTYYAAHKYNLVELEDYLVKFMRRNANPENILDVLSQAEFYRLRILQSYCWSMIEKQTLQIVRSEAFSHLKWDHLCGILENSRLTIKEHELFLGVMRWCSVEGRRPHNVGKSATDLIGVAVYKLRFPVMTSSEFEFVIRTGLLKAGEVADLKTNFRKNANYSHQIRRNDCHCRRYHIQCKLCTDDHFPFIPVDGRIPKVAKKKSTTPKSLPAVQNNGSKNNALLMSEKANFVENKCECMKYFSCPAYPNGVSATIMMASNLFS